MDAPPLPADSFPRRAKDILLAACDAMPTAEQVEHLRRHCAPGEERGYFTPDEETRIRAVFVDFLQVRAALGEVILEARERIPLFRRRLSPEELKVFVPGWLAGCMVLRGSRYLVQHFKGHKQIHRLLNRPAPREGVPEGMFDRVDHTSTRIAHLSRFFWGLRVAETNAQAIQALASDPDVGPLIPLLQREEPFLQRQKRVHARAYAACRLGKARHTPRHHLQRLSWALFETGGRFIAECRNPFHQHRVRRPVLRLLAQDLQPGDVVVTRHDDALSNWFLPGFWPHAALCLGDADQRRALNLAPLPHAGKRMIFLEARKDGVKLRSLPDTFSVDAFVVLRPRRLSDPERAKLVERALAHEGKLYDFEFDFTRSDRLVCTEVIYRSLDGVGDIRFHLLRKVGRYTLPAEELIRQALDSGAFAPLLLYGVKGNQVHTHERALHILTRTLPGAGTS